MPRKLTDEDFQERYTVEPMYAMTEESCWTWMGPTRPDGYGSFNINMQKILAHRYSYERSVGKVPEDLEIDHRCAVKSCVNPAHLEPVTHAENIRRGFWGQHQLEKTHCPRGHEYNEKNTYNYKGRRCCRACNNIITLERYHLKRKK